MSAAGGPLTKLPTLAALWATSTIGPQPSMPFLQGNKVKASRFVPSGSHVLWLVVGFERSAGPRRSFSFWTQRPDAEVYSRREPTAKRPAEAGLFIQTLPALTSVPVVHFLLRPVFGVTISLLKFPFELVLLAGDDVKVIIG